MIDINNNKMSANKFLKIIKINKNNFNNLKNNLNNLKNNFNKINVELNNLKNNLNENNHFYDYRINMIDCKIMMVGGVLFIIPYFLK
jgi:hypothetical protein